MPRQEKDHEWYVERLYLAIALLGKQQELNLNRFDLIEGIASELELRNIPKLRATEIMNRIERRLETIGSMSDANYWFAVDSASTFLAEEGLKRGDARRR